MSAPELVRTWTDLSPADRARCDRLLGNRPFWGAVRPGDAGGALPFDSEAAYRQYRALLAEGTKRRR